MHAHWKIETRDEHGIWSGDFVAQTESVNEFDSASDAWAVANIMRKLWRRDGEDVADGDIRVVLA